MRGGLIPAPVARSGAARPSAPSGSCAGLPIITRSPFVQAGQHLVARRRLEPECDARAPATSLRRIDHQHALAAGAAAPRWEWRARAGARRSSSVTVAYMPGTSSSDGLGTSISTIMVRVLSSTLSEKRAILPLKIAAPSESTLHADRRIEADAAHVVDRHREVEPQQRVVGHAHQRHGLGVARPCPPGSARPDRRSAW